MRKMTHFLESVLAGNSDRTFTSLDRTKKARIPLLVGRKTSKNITRYSTNVQEILSYENLKAHPNRVQLQNLAQASMLYAVYTSLGDQHPKVNEVNKAINAYMRGGEIRGINVNRFSEEAEKFVNMTWGELFKTTAPEDVKTINDCATIILDSALNELAENGDLELVDIKIDKAKTASRLFLRAFNANLIHSKQTPLTTADAITEVYSSVKERIRDFYQQRYHSSNRHDYLYTLMNNHSREIQDLCDPANISFEHIKNYIKFIEVDERPSEDNAIANADYKKARINRKQNFRGKISAYIKEDQVWPDVYHLIINVTHYEGQSNHSESLMLYSHNENALDSHSPNLLGPFIKSSNRVAPLIDEKRALELAEQVERNRQLQLETAERLKEENRVKREQSIDSYLALETVTNPNQLEGTYFEQKAIAQLAVKYIPNLRIDSEKNVWLPLANVAEQNASIDNIEGFQKYLPYKDEISGTNKLFEGIGEGRKNEACAVLGNPKEASVLIECEGVANGLIAIEMANQKGIKAAAICALDVGNLPYTTGKIIASHPMKPIVNLADNDLFNSEKERRYLRHELAALNITDSPKTRNVGLVRAIEMTNAINLPHITFDFEKDFSCNLIDLQKERKGSDIDDAINFLYEVKTGLGEENAAQSAWQEVSDVLVDKINTSMHYNISPHWSIDKQEQFAWCASVENLDSPTLSDYYHLKEIITNSHDVFEKKYELPYDVYRLESLTNHSPLNDTELEVDNKLAQQFDSTIEEYLDSQPTTQTITERDADSHRCEPIPAIDVGIEHLMPPTIVESTIYVDTKIHSITRKLDNIEKSLTKMSGYEYQTRIDKNMRELDRLLDEKARLIGVSARQLKQTDQLANYYDREEEIQSAIELANRQTNFQPSDEDWEQLEEAERTRTTSRSSYVFDYQLDKPEEESEIEQLAKVDANELLNKVLASFTSEQEQPPLPPSQINSRELEQIYHNQLAEISEELNNSSFGNEDGTLQSHREVVRSIVNELSNIDSQIQGQEIYEKYGFDKYWGQYDGDKAELDAEMADVETSTDTVADDLAAPVQHEQQLDAEMADVETSTGIVADDLATPTQHEQQLNAEMADVERSTDTVADGTATPTQHEQQLDAEMADVETSTNTVADDLATQAQHEQQLDSEMANVETSTDTVADDLAAPAQHEQQLDAEMADVETSTDTVADGMDTFSEENRSSSTDRDVFLNAVKLMAAQNQQTLTTLSTIMEKMMAQQNSLFERQAEMFAQIIQSQQDMMSKILSSQTEINHRLDAMQQHLGLDSTITAKGNAIDNSTATTQPPSKQATDSRQLLMQRFVKNHEDIVTKRALLDELDQQIKNQRVTPKEVAAVINPSGVNPKNSDIPIKQATTIDNKANHYNSVIEHLRSNRTSLNDGYKSSSKEVKQLISDAINLKCTPITLSELRTNTVKIKGAVLKVANDIFQDERYPRGFPMSIALAEALKNDTSERVPASAVINIAAALYTEKENPLSRISESLVSGQISTEAYYRECHKQLGTQSFDLKMGEEYNAYLESQKLNKQEPHENRAPISEPIHEI